MTMHTHQEQINNEIYNNLGDRWYRADDDPVALLRAEARTRNPWIRKTIKEKLQGTIKPLRVLDMGCGGGFLSNDLAKDGHQVVGVDLSKTSLEIAKAYDTTQSVNYLLSDVTAVPLPSASFDVVCAMDLLEHVENPHDVIRETSRLLKPGGLFFLYTFNRTFISWLFAIKALEWFVKNTPAHLHVYRMFIKPVELNQMCESTGLEVSEVHGIKPVILAKPTLELLLTGKVNPNFRFKFTKSTQCGYLCYGTKRL